MRESAQCAFIMRTASFRLVPHAVGSGRDSWRLASARRTDRSASNAREQFVSDYQHDGNEERGGPRGRGHTGPRARASTGLPQAGQFPCAGRKRPSRGHVSEWDGQRTAEEKREEQRAHEKFREDIDDREITKQSQTRTVCRQSWFLWGVRYASWRHEFIIFWLEVKLNVKTLSYLRLSVKWIERKLRFLFLLQRCLESIETQKYKLSVLFILNLLYTKRRMFF